MLNSLDEINYKQCSEMGKWEVLSLISNCILPCKHGFPNRHLAIINTKIKQRIDINTDVGSL